jgi:SAM-dependent methyltransferase
LKERRNEGKRRGPGRKELDMRELKEEKPWFVEWFDENYRMLYRHRNSEEARKQVQLILDTLKPSKAQSIMDLCCGEGRYTEIFHNHGYSITGLDLSETLIRIGKERSPQLELVVGDMREIPGHFDIILSLFTSFGYFDSDEENHAALQSVFHALNPGGMYWLDFLNPPYVETHLEKETLSQLPNGIEVLEKRKIENNRIIKDIHFRDINEDNVKPVKHAEKEYKESVRLFSRDELEKMFERTGFRLVASFGDYKGNPWSTGSERTILVGRKET